MTVHCWLHGLGFNLPWKTNEGFGRMHKQAIWRLIRESVDHRGLTQEKPTGSEWQRALQKDGSWFKVQFPKEQFSVKLSAGFGAFPEVQMYLSSGKLRTKASPSCLLLLPYRTACSSCICSTEGWMSPCLCWHCIPGLEWHCHQLWCSWAELGAPGSWAVTDVFATTAEWAPAVLQGCSVGVTGVKNKNNNTRAGGLQQGMGSWEFLQQCVPGMEMRGKAADQKCWSSCGCGEGAQQSAQVFVCSHADRWSVHKSKPAAFQWWLAGLNAAHSGLKWNSSSLLCWQAADDGCEHDTQFSLPAAHPGLFSGLARKFSSPYQKER